MSLIGVLHPGAMGTFLASAFAAEDEVGWVSAGRSEQTRQRASDLREFATLAELAAAAELLVSICPPGRARELAAGVGATGFAGLYLDANAVSPATMHAVVAALPRASVVDGAVIGGPSTDSAVLHLSGPDAARVATLVDADVLRVEVHEAAVGAASALKASYALTTKAKAALLFAARASARASGMEAPLIAEWERTQPGLTIEVDRGAAPVGRKAWRFVDEMREAAGYLEDLGLPGGFSGAAAEVYARLSELPRDADVEAAEAMDLLIAATRPPA